MTEENAQTEESLVLQPQTPEHPLAAFDDGDLARLLGRAARVTAVLGAAVSLILWPAMGWRNGATFAVGAMISVGSIYEWGRLIRLFNARLDQQKTPRGAGLRSGLVVGLFLARLMLFAAAIYVSLKSLHGSPLVLVGGLTLAVAGLVWEALKLLRGA
uniref:ATP synthase I chain n=1 Tax=mine drainage metagenome TaxID=410659 RepID=E6PZ38_9ZZZZ